MEYSIRDSSRVEYKEPEVELWLEATREGIYLMAREKGHEKDTWNLLKVESSGEIYLCAGVPDRLGFVLSEFSKIRIRP